MLRAVCACAGWQEWAVAYIDTADQYAACRMWMVLCGRSAWLHRRSEVQFFALTPVLTRADAIA